MEKERFSLLLLEPGEIYFEDFSCYIFPPNITENTFERLKEIGRLKMCSKSIVFDPKDINKPLIKIPLKECVEITEWKGSLKVKITPNDVISVTCRQYVEMLAGNILAPYTFKAERRTFLFLLNYARASDCLPQICQLYRASTLPAAEQNSMVVKYPIIECTPTCIKRDPSSVQVDKGLYSNKIKVYDSSLITMLQDHGGATFSRTSATIPTAIATIVHSRQSRVSFDTLWLEDLYEKVIMESQGSKITPLVVNPGRVLLTSSRLYFQPYNNVESYPVLKIRLQDIKRIIPRRFLLRHVGLEIYCDNTSHVTHLYLSFKSQADRDELYSNLKSQPLLRLENTEKEMMTLQWQNGVLSNFDYLLYLNSMADRTFNDLTQYPVFPWVIQDYTSEELDLENPKSYRDLRKPIGALNEVRLARLKERAEEMSPPRFLYGSHYSAPGFVLFYLVRKYPHYMLCLQNGRFDHPDRMFNSVPDVWKNVMTNMSDFKEVIPAFYDTQQAGDFLVNSLGINFGYRHDGTKVGDVQLPPWATGPQEFVKKMRAALESEHVSKNLHHWIDLIFGYKQTGEEAVKADNLFYYLCYEGAVDLDSITDMNQRHALEVQIMEFGQIPKQIFSVPHPQRLIGLPEMISFKLEDDESESSIASEKSCKFRERVQSLCQFPVWQNVDSLQCAASFQSHKEAVSAVAISATKQYVVSVGQDSLLKMYSLAEKRQVRSVTVSSMTLSSCIILPDDKTLIVGSWDNNITLYNLEFGRVMDSVRGHEDAISCLVWGNSSQLLISGSWDCSVRVWKGMAEGKRIKPASSLVAQLDHDSHITCLALTRDNKQLVSGTQDGDLFLWAMDSYSLKQQLPGHDGTIYGACFSPDSNKLVSCGEDRTFKVLDLTTGMQLYNKTLDEELRCLVWDGFSLILGGGLGTIYIWDLVQVKMLKQIHDHVGAVLALAVSEDGSIVVSGGEDRRVTIWQPATAS